MRDWRALPASQAVSLCAAMSCQPESWVHRALVPDWQWEAISTQISARALDAIEWIQWSKTTDAAAGRNRPPRFPRPGLEDQSTSPGHGYQALPIDELDRLLALPRT